MKKILLLFLGVMLLCWCISSAATPTMSRNASSPKIGDKAEPDTPSAVSTRVGDQTQKALPKEKSKSIQAGPAPVRNPGDAIISSDGRTASEFLIEKELLKKKAITTLVPDENSRNDRPASIPGWYTPPSITDIILTEDFENGGRIPTGWDDCCNHQHKWNFDGGNPVYGAPAPHGGQYAAFFDVYNYGWGTTDTLISPSMNLSIHSGSYAIAFWYWDAPDPEGIQDSITLFVSEGGVDTYLGKLPQSVPVWTQLVYTFNSTSSSVKIKFAGFSCSGNTDPYIDDFLVADYVDVGRCCYGDPANPSCDDISQAACAALNGNWQYGATCASDTCQAFGDNCSAPFEITSFPYTDTRNTADFNNDVNPEYIGGDVVYRFTITEPMYMNIGLCNTEVPFSTYMGVWREGNCGAVGDYDIWCNWGGCAAYWELASILDAVFAAGTYYIMVEPSWNATSDGIYTLDVTAVSVTPVIDFQVTAPGQWTGNTCGAGNDCGLNASEDQIYEVTIPYDGTWLFALCNSPTVWDTYMSIGTSYCDADVAGNDDGCGGDTYYLSRISVPLTAGVYYVTVEGLFSSGCGPYTLDIIEAPPPPWNDDCADVNPADYPLSDSIPLVFTGDNSNATQDCPTNGLSEVWIPFSTDTCMDVTINFCGTNPPASWANITLNTDCPCGEAIWSDSYNWTDCGDGNWTLHFYNLPAGNYYYPLNADLTWDPTGPYTLTVIGTVCQPPPVNDNCANATPIGNVENLPWSTRSATFDGNGVCMYSSNIWYLYTADCDGLGFFSLCGSDLDTKIAVYDGVTCDSLPVELSCNDDACGWQSQIIIPVTAGNQYLIEIGGYDVYVGDGVLTTACLLPPLNDNCADVNPVDYPLFQGYPVVFEGNNIGATSDCDQLSWAQVWIPFSTYECMDVTISSCGTAPALTTMGRWLFNSCPCGDYTEVDIYNATDCEDGNWTAKFYNLPPGNYYYPLYSDSAQGPYTITVSGTTCLPPPPDPCENAYYANGAYDGSGSVTSDRHLGIQFDAWAADDVVLTEEVTISAISWYTVTDIGYDFQNTADVLIMADSGGVPGAPILELIGVAATQTANRDYLFNTPVYYYAISNLNFTLGPGTFWIALRPINHSTTDQSFSLTAPLTGSEFYFRSDYFSFPNWISASDLGETPANISFCFGTQGGCVYIPGDLNGIGGANGIDVVYGVTFLKGGSAPTIDCNPPCLTYTNPNPPYQQLPLADPFYAAMDVNGNCGANGIDITYFVAFLKGLQPTLLYCPDCESAGRLAKENTAIQVKGND